MYDYYLGGKDNVAIDRETAEAALKNWPSGPIAARGNRGFLARPVGYLADEVRRRPATPLTGRIYRSVPVPYIVIDGGGWPPVLTDFAVEGRVRCRTTFLLSTPRASRTSLA